METSDYAMTTTGLMGVGKTFARVRYGVQDLLKREGGGNWYTNFPLKVDRICEVCAERYDRPESEFRDRVRLIPPEVIRSWQHGESGPWDFFDVDEEGHKHPERNNPLAGAHIAIDEAHTIVGKNQRTDAIKKWQDWISHIRHYGGKIEFVTQSRTDIHRDLLNRIGTRLCVVSLGEEPIEPRKVIGYKWDVWFQVLSKFMQRDCFWYDERIAINVDGREQKHVAGTYLRDPDIYQFYDSYSQRDGSAGDFRDKKVWETHSWPGLLLWIFTQRPVHFVAHVTLPPLLVLLFIFRAEVVAYLMPKTGNQAKAEQVEQSKASKIDQAIENVKTRADLSPSAEKEIRTYLELLQVADKKAGEIVNENSKLREEMQAMRDNVDASFAVSLVQPEGVAFRGGYYYKIGEKIDFGPYEGRTIEAIDWGRRAARLDDGTMLRLGFAGGVQTPEVGEAESSSGTISSGVREAAKRREDASREPTPGRVSNGQRSGNADGGLRQTP